MTYSSNLNSGVMVISKPKGNELVTGSESELPLIPLHNIVLFPNNSIPLSSLSGLSSSDCKKAIKGNLLLGIVPTRDVKNHQSPCWNSIGVEAYVTGLIRFPNGETGVMLKAKRRFYITRVQKRRYGYIGKVNIAKDHEVKRTKLYNTYCKSLRGEITRFLKSSVNIQKDVRKILVTNDDPLLLCDLIIPNLVLSLEEKLNYLSQFDPLRRIKSTVGWLKREMDYLQLSDKIHNEVDSTIKEEYRRYYLKEQIGALKKELGELDGYTAGVDDLETKLSALALPKLTKEAVNEELERLGMMSPGSPEYIVSYNYLSLIRELPWKSKPLTPFRLNHAKTLLDKEHYGLLSVKNRILEYLAVIQHRGELSGQVLLLNGPPGVGKTSLAKTISGALRRPFAKVALGGIKDEAEIRGHRKTYIGSMPGKIIQAIKQLGTQYAVILLDEIDKLGNEKQQDLDGALLEVLDNEQNSEFLDHYLSVPFDISNVLFIATSNDQNKISDPLLDRMEVIDIPSYTDLDKLEIAKRHIIPTIRKELNLTAKLYRLSDKAVLTIIRNYTMEAGVRQLKRELISLARKKIRKIIETTSSSKIPNISCQNLINWLGPPKYLESQKDTILPKGVSIGLAYTDLGGEILYIEVNRTVSKGNGAQVLLTGNIGKVMKESAQTGLSYILGNSPYFGIQADQVLNYDFHIHIPDGATPKDGPSAGLAIICALYSYLLEQPIPIKVAMTGEISLRGRVLPVGGIREKILAAHRYGKKKIIIPALNQADLMEIPDKVQEDLEIIAVTTITEAFDHLGFKALL